MSEILKLELLSRSPEDTRTISRQIGRHAFPGIVITLNGDLGCGKTTFTQGLARGLDVPEEYYVTSPTFTLINEYPGRLRLYHVDLYRLAGKSDMEEIGLYDIIWSDHVTVIEWADRLWDEDLPERRLGIDLEIISEHERKFLMTAYGLDAINLINGIDTEKWIC